MKFQYGDRVILPYNELEARKDRWEQFYGEKWNE